MRVKIQKWGNSLALRIPRAFAFQSEIRENKFVELKLEGKKIFIEPVEDKPNLEEMIGKINKQNIHKETDFGNSLGAERW